MRKGKQGGKEIENQYKGLQTKKDTTQRKTKVKEVRKTEKGKQRTRHSWALGLPVG
jgi:hypothetical protein